MYNNLNDLQQEALELLKEAIIFEIKDFGFTTAEELEEYLDTFEIYDIASKISNDIVPIYRDCLEIFYNDSEELSEDYTEMIEQLGKQQSGNSIFDNIKQAISWNIFNYLNGSRAEVMEEIIDEYREDLES